MAFPYSHSILRAALGAPGVALIVLSAVTLASPTPLLAQGAGDNIVFGRGDLGTSGLFVINDDDLNMLRTYFEDLDDVGGGCDSSGQALDAADINDNTPEGALFTLGPNQRVITVADLVNLQAKVDGTVSDLPLPPPSMCGLDSAACEDPPSPCVPTSEIDESGSIVMTLETTGFDGATQEVSLKLRMSPALLGTFGFHGVGLALPSALGVSGVTFTPDVVLDPDAITILLGPGDIRNPTDALLFQLGSSTEIAAIGSTDVTIGRFSFPTTTQIAEPFLPPGIEVDGLPDPLAVGSKVFWTTVVGKQEAAFIGNSSGLPTAIYTDHIPQMGEAVVVPSDFRRGDANSDSQLDIADGVFLLQHLFLGGNAPSCAEAADFDASGMLSVGDAVAVFHHQLLGGSPPAAPHPSCGVAPGGDLLGCADYPAALCD